MKVTSSVQHIKLSNVTFLHIIGNLQAENGGAIKELKEVMWIYIFKRPRLQIFQGLGFEHFVLFLYII